MNVWLRDPRVEKAEVEAFEAERAERRADFANARARYHDAAEAFASVAIGVPADHPNTRSDLAIAAVACFARAGDLGRAIEFGRRVLTEGDALTKYGQSELLRLVGEYDHLLRRTSSSSHGSNRGDLVRGDVRGQFRYKGAA